MKKRFDWFGNRYLYFLDNIIFGKKTLSVFLNKEEKRIYVISEYLESSEHELSVVEFNTSPVSDETLLENEEHPETTEEFYIVFNCGHEDFTIPEKKDFMKKINNILELGDEKND